MKVSLDLDGTAWKHRKFFAELARALQSAGHQVGILTAHGEGLKEADLRLWRARGFPEPDFFYHRGDIGWGSPIKEQKLVFAASVGIDAHIDDWDSDSILELVVMS